MRSKDSLKRRSLALVILIVLFVMVACQPLDEQQEETAEVRKTAEPTASVGDQETTDKVDNEDAADVSSGIPMTGETELEEIVSVTEFFSLQVPVGWSSEEVLPGGNFVMANSEEALARYRNDMAIEPGDFVVNIGFLPYRLLQTNELRSLDFQYEAPPDVFFQSLMAMFRMTDGIVTGEPQLVYLNGEREASLVTVSEAGQEGTILMISAGDSVIALVSSVAFPGEMSQFQGIAESVAAEIEFSGDQDALYGVLLGG